MKYLVSLQFPINWNLGWAVGEVVLSIALKMVGGNQYVPWSSLFKLNLEMGCNKNYLLIYLCLETW